MRFNKETPGTKTTNLAGGKAYTETPKLELASILLTSFAQDKYYESASDTFNRIKALIPKTGPEFAAKAAVYARREFGMRSISHVVAGELCKTVSGESWMKDFLNAIVYRPDDVTEITAYYLQDQKKVTNAMRKGLGRALTRFDSYQLAKYRAEGAKVSLVDCANLYHPKSTPAIKALVAGTLRSKNTWESKLTEAGQKAETKEQKEELKADAWATLLKENKLGYFALLRNLRNIAEQAPEVLNQALAQLVDAKKIKKSLVLPFRFITAMSQLRSVPGSRKIVQALSEALDLSVNNVPAFEGKTLIAIDESSSMGGRYWNNIGEGGGKSPSEIAGLFGAALYKSNDADVMMFAGSSRFVNPNPADSAMTIARQLKGSGGCTNFHCVFTDARNRYDRIIILSDMQGWMEQGYHSAGAPTQAAADYRKRMGVNPHIYSFDLQGYGTLMFPESQVYCLAGFSEKVFDIMKMLEQDRNALVNRIEATSLVVN